MKQIVPANKSKEIALETIREVAGIVKATLGPGGNPIIIQRSGQNPDGTPKSPLITKDGVTVAEAISFKDPVKDTIAKAIIQAASKTVNEAGDGTTSSLVLAEAIYTAGFRFTEQGQNSILLYEELKSLKDEVLEYIDSQKIDITPEYLEKVALVSSNGDSEIASIVAQAIEKVGEDGHITLEEGVSRETVLDIVEGSVYKKGWRDFSPLGSLLVTDKSRDVCEMNDAAILLYNGRLTDHLEVAQLIGKLYKADGNQVAEPFPLLLVANDFSDEVKNLILANRKQGNLPIAAIKTPFDGSPNARTGILEDLAVLTGATVAARGITDLKQVTEDHLGSAEKIVIGPQETVFYGGRGDADEIVEHIQELKRLIQETPAEFDKDNLRIRIGKLTGGIAVIRVGGDSELEILEKKDRIEDALCAAKVAIADGVIAGGGIALMNWCNGDESSPARAIFNSALKEPFNQIIRNIGESPEAVLTRMEMTGCKGYNARTKECVPDNISAGIVDPAKVTKAALENAVSIAGMLLTTGGAVVNEQTSSDGQPNPLAGLL